MFLNFFGFEDQPFGVTPDPKYIFWSHCHREALSTLYYGIQSNRGFITMIAPPGLGKTTLIFHLLEHLRGTHQTVFIFQTRCNSVELLRFLLADLGCVTPLRDPVEMQAKINCILADFARSGKQLVVVLDEAQNLASPVLETVRLLTNFEQPDRKLIQIVLSGQSQLEDKLKHPALAQLRQRISMTARLHPLSSAEVHEYIEHRIRVAGCRGDSPFLPEALDRIAAHSEGIPRVINGLCFSSLSLAYARQLKKVGASVVEETVADVSLSLPSLMADTRRSAENPNLPPPHTRNACSEKPASPSAERGEASGEPADRQQEVQPSADDGHEELRRLRKWQTDGRNERGEQWGEVQRQRLLELTDAEQSGHPEGPSSEGRQQKRRQMRQIINRW